jgi:hypothetical protein
MQSTHRDDLKRTICRLLQTHEHVSEGLAAIRYALTVELMETIRKVDYKSVGYTTVIE